METRVAVISIIVEEGSATDEVNAVLHEFNSIIIGRMGMPYTILLRATSARLTV